jgi:hypothetical protein
MSAQTDWAEEPETNAGFTRIGASMGGGGLLNVIKVLAEIKAERERANKTYWTYSQYDRFFDAVHGAKDMAHKGDAAGGLRLRYIAARNAGKSEWDFAQSEQRLRDVHDQRSARLGQVNAEVAASRTQQASTANAASSYFPPIPAKSIGLSPAHVDDKPEYLAPDPFGDDA